VKHITQRGVIVSRGNLMISFTDKELYDYLKRYTNNLVNNSKDTGIFDVEALKHLDLGFKVFYASDVKKAMNQTQRGNQKQ
jgi:hypothetical protein